MNARQAAEQDEALIKQIIKLSKRVMEVRGVNQMEALEYGRKVDLEYAKTDTQKSAINLRYDKVKRIISRERTNKEIEQILAESKEYGESKGITQYEAIEILKTKAQKESKSLVFGMHLENIYNRALDRTEYSQCHSCGEVFLKVESEWHSVCDECSQI